MKTPTMIAIDGPAASGKSTIGQMLAEHLGYLYLDTGSMYRAVTLAAIQAGVDPQDEHAVTKLAGEIDLDIQPVTDETDGRQYTVLLNQQDVTWDLRNPNVDSMVSLVSSYSGVRQELVRLQRQFGLKGNVVMVGRDIGTVVMPDAPLKFFITAKAEERALRRLLDRQAQGHDANYEAILADVNRRDRFDSSRKLSPLKPAEDAIIIDTTGKTPEIVLSEILSHLGNQVLDSQYPRVK